ncbi:MAG: peptide deformylase [Sulfurimicrobium sp.]
MIRSVLRMGEPRLLELARPVRDFHAPELHTLIADMRDTMAALNGAGLAAPQVGVALQVVIFGGFKSPRYPEAEEIPDTVLINPQLEFIGGEMEEDWEGCLSLPGMRGKVPRYRRLRYRGFDLEGRAIDRAVSGFHARVAQHECDHLNGILYPMRIADLRLFGFTEVLFPELPTVDERS